MAGGDTNAKGNDKIEIAWWPSWWSPQVKFAASNSGIVAQGGTVKLPRFGEGDAQKGAHYGA